MEVIIVVPFDLPAEVISYYYKICELGDLSDYKERVHFVCPENISKFPKNFSLAKLLYYSPQALQRIRTIVNHRQAYLVPVSNIKQSKHLSDFLLLMFSSSGHAL